MYTGSITVDGDTVVGAKSSAQGHGNFSTIYVEGTWGGGTLTASATPDGGDTVFPIEDISFTEDGYANVAIKTTSLVLTLTGATSPDLTYWIV